MKEKDLGKITALLANLDASRDCLVFCNQPATAREVHERLSASKKGFVPMRVLLLTGRLREREASAVRAEVLDPEVGMPWLQDIFFVSVFVPTNKMAETTFGASLIQTLPLSLSLAHSTC